MRSCVSITDTDYGIMMYDGREMSKLLSSFTYTSRKVAEPKYMCPASGWCTSFSTSCLQVGLWHLPAPKELVELTRDITQGTGTPDVLNRTIVAAGGKAISNGSLQWTCARYDPSNACCYGTSGCLSDTTLYNPWFVASPLSLHILEN